MKEIVLKSPTTPVVDIEELRWQLVEESVIGYLNDRGQKGLVTRLGFDEGPYASLCFCSEITKGNSWSATPENKTLEGHIRFFANLGGKFFLFDNYKEFGKWLAE